MPTTLEGLEFLYNRGINDHITIALNSFDCKDYTGLTRIELMDLYQSFNVQELDLFGTYRSGDYWIGVKNPDGSYTVSKLGGDACKDITTYLHHTRSEQCVDIRGRVVRVDLFDRVTGEELTIRNPYFHLGAVDESRIAQALEALSDELKEVKSDSDSSRSSE